MRTIESILDYNLTEAQKQALYSVWIVNGIGGEGQNIEKALLAIIELLPWYDNDKAEALLGDIRELSVEHDIRFYFQTGFYWANYVFAKGIFHLLHWSNWKRLVIAITTFLILNRGGKKFYNREKRI